MIRRSRYQRPRDTLVVPGDSFFRRINLGKRLRNAIASRLVPLALLAAMVWLGQHLFLSGTFALKRVEVVGNRLEATEEIRAAAGLADGTIFHVHRQNVRARVLRLRPIQSVDVAVRWPDTVRLTVVERRPTSIWKVDPTLYLVSDEGIVLAPTTQENQAVILVDIDRTPVRVGDQVDTRAVTAARYLRNTLPSVAGITPHYFEYSRAMGVILPTDRGFRVAFGFGDDLPTKVVTFRAILDAIAQQKLKAEFIDLRFKDHPYFR
ncbi:MAG: FtsQ-type POTRA domain-containing protein [Chloroflexi bacterium]|nr:FtsQ-type POTRA domain-containing protein [Chloroflexota bacterium]